MIDLSVPRRQSALAIVFLGIRIARSFGAVQAAVAIFFIVRGAIDGRLGAVALLMFAAFGAVSVLAWWRYTFQLVGAELVVEKGVFRHDRLAVPIERIQSVSIEQELLHRLVGLVKVSIDTAGSTETEFAIDAVPRDVADELQRRTVDSTATRSPINERAIDEPEAGDRIVFSHDPQRLVLAAVTTPPWAGLVVLGSLFALTNQLGRDVESEIRRVDVGGFRWWWVPVGLTVFVAISFILNIAGVLLRDWQLTLRAGPSRLRRTSGLLSRTSRSSNVTRVQLVSSFQNPLQRRAALRNVTLSTASEHDLTLIGCDDAQFDTIRALTTSATTNQLQLGRRVDGASVWLSVRNMAVVAGATAAAGYVALGWWSGVALLAVPVVWATERRRVANFRWALGAEFAATSRVIGSSTKQLLLRKTNTVRVTQSLFERRRNLAHVHVATAAGVLSVGMLPFAEACAVRDVVLHAAETDRRDWM